MWLGAFACGMERRQLVLAVHGFIALGMVGFGALRITAGNAIGGALNLVAAAMVVALGVLLARRFD
jgi:hypothetical protein